MDTNDSRGILVDPSRENLRALLAAIVDSSDDAIVSKTLDGVITSWNRGAEKLFGYTAAEAIGQHIFLIIPEDRRPEEEDVLARLRRGEKIDHFETVRQTKDGRLIPISLTVSPIRDAEGAVIGASKVARDITERLQTRRAPRTAGGHCRFLRRRHRQQNAGRRHHLVESRRREALWVYRGRGHRPAYFPDYSGGSADGRGRRARSYFAGESESSTSETVRRAKDGRQVHISLTVSPIRDAKGTIIGASKVARDISERIHRGRGAEARARGTGRTRP